MFDHGLSHVNLNNIPDASIFLGVHVSVFLRMRINLQVTSNYTQVFLFSDFKEVFNKEDLLHIMSYET